MLYTSSTLLTHSFCIYGGATGTDLISCPTSDDVEHTNQMVPIDGQMLPTSQMTPFFRLTYFLYMIAARG